MTKLTGHFLRAPSKDLAFTSLDKGHVGLVEDSLQQGHYWWEDGGADSLRAVGETRLPTHTLPIPMFCRGDGSLPSCMHDHASWSLTPIGDNAELLDSKYADNTALYVQDNEMTLERVGWHWRFLVWQQERKPTGIGFLTN